MYVCISPISINEHMKCATSLSVYDILFIIDVCIHIFRSNALIYLSIDRSD